MTVNNESILPISIHDEVKSSFLDYAMSVIVSRALPDVRDGLKPVHRRILYAMSEMGLSSDRAHRKAARIVGEVLGKFHPHGDLAVYDALVRLAQEFSTRYPLVDGHGNFGSVDGDPAAAMRYTEARMSKIAVEMLTDIKKDTVDFRPNFDESMEEPWVLPSRFPNLLVNGSAGIAVGMATNIPPHNLGEVIDSIVYLIDHPDADIQTLMGFVQGPDFPTGGVILGREGIRTAYSNGRGIIKVRGKVTIENKDPKNVKVVITEIPYQQNKARLVEKIADLVKEKKMEGISDLRDESNRLGIRVVLDVRRDYDPNVIINQMFRYTPLQQSYGINILALVNGKPQVLNLKDMAVHYLDHQKEIITRRSAYDLKRAKERLHIVEGLQIALSNLDEVISIIRNSADVGSARDNLIQRFSLSEKQAQAILDMRLQRLTALERDKLYEEGSELKGIIDYLEKVLADEKLVLGIIKEELTIIKNKHADKRRTQIVDEETEIMEKDLVLEEDVVITLTHHGFIKRIPLDTYRIQRRGGKGIAGTITRENDFVVQMYISSTHSNLLCFSNMGRVYLKKVHEIPEIRRQSRGTPIINLLPLQKEEYITTVLPIIDFQREQFLLMVTSHGYIKKTPLKAFGNVRKTGVTALTLSDEDELIGVLLTSGTEQVILGAGNARFIRFSQEEIRPMGRSARGVRGMRLSPPARLIGVDIAQEDQDILMVTSKGYGKRISLRDLRGQKRGGKGLLGLKTDLKRGELCSFKLFNEDEDVMIITAKGIILRQKAGEVPRHSRYSRGVTLIKVAKDDRVAILAGVE